MSVKDNSKAIIESLTKQINEIMIEQDKNVVDNIQSITPVKTGKLRASVSSQHENLKSNFGSDVVYAPTVEWLRMNPAHMFRDGLEMSMPDYIEALKKAKV